MPMNYEYLLAWLVASFVVSGGGAYLGSYLKTKGKNFATKEDIGELTQITKEIEAKISGEMWDRQKRWELIRDVLFEGAKRLAELDDALLSYHSALTVAGVPELIIETRHAGLLRCRNALQRFDETRLLVAIVCSDQTRRALDSFSSLVGQMLTMLNRNEIAKYDETRRDLAYRYMASVATIRRELGIESPVIPQSKESLAVPSPGGPSR